jgi:hypothetical protein
LACGERIESAEAVCKFGGGQAALAAQGAQESSAAVSPFWVLHSVQQETRLR